MTVSVVLPVRDGERYLRESLDSVFAQDPRPYEVIVVDDGSRDATGDVIASYGQRIKAIRQARLGHAGALNTGVVAASGSVLAFQDADDVWVPDRLELLLSALDERTDAVFGWLEQFVSPDLDPPETARLRVDTDPQLAFLVQTMIVRSEALTAVGAFDESLDFGSNIDWISRARLSGLRTRTVTEVVTRRRIHETNMGRQVEQKNATLLRIMRSHLQRHRQAGAAPARPDRDERL